MIPPASDAELLAAWHGGDGRAGDELVRRHFGAVYRFFVTKLDDGCEDLVQQTFLQCLASAGRYTGTGTVRSFLLGIARHQLYGVLRKRRRERHALERNDMSIERIMGSPATGLELRTRLDVLRVALRRLPVDLQIAVELSYWEDLRLAEIASVLEIPEGTVKSRLFRARAELRAAIESLAASDAVARAALADLDATADELGRSFARAAPRK